MALEVNDAGSAPFRGHRWFSAFYTRVASPLNKKLLDPIARDLLSGLTGDVLEIGAGGGALFPHYPRDARVVAVEPDPHMRKRAAAHLRPNIELRDGRAEHLPAADASMDAVVSSLVLCTVEDLPGALAEVRRVLKPCGRFIFIEHVRSEGRRGRFQDVVQPVYGRLAGGCHWNRRTEQALRGAGFTLERLDRLRFAPLTPGISGVAIPV